MGLVNCASAIFPTSTETIDLKKLNLMWEVTTRAPLLTAKHCIPHLKASAAAGRDPHILTCSPPVDLRTLPQPQNPNYMVCKMGMSVGAITMSEELRSVGIAANTMRALQTFRQMLRTLCSQAKAAGSQEIWLLMKMSLLRLVLQIFR